MSSMAARSLLFAYAVCLLGCASTAPTTSPARAAPSLTWRSFDKAAFDEAKREHKLVFVDAGIEGCTACRWMHETTLTDPEVVRRLAREFVVVSVDADQQPDVGARFADLSWPALVFFDADGHMLRAIRGNKVPAHFLPILDEVEHAAGSAPAAPAPSPPTAADQRCAHALAELDRRVGSPSPGDPLHVEGAPFVVELARGGAFADKARVVAADTAKLVDPVWGGVYVGAFGEKGSLFVVPEKRANRQASALELFAADIATASDDGARTAVAGIARYLGGTLAAPGGGFYATQRDAPPGLPSSITSAAYYALDEKGRLRFGRPAVDHGVYADQNGRVVVALAHAWDAGGDDALLALAVRAVDALTARIDDHGVVAQFVPSDAVAHDPRLRPIHDDARPALAAQASVGLAALALFSSTGDAKYAALADRLARGLDALADPAGGFFDTTPRDVDALVGREKSVVDNVAAARFLFALAELHHDDAARDRAVRTLASVGDRPLDDTGEVLGQFLLALSDEERGVVDVSVAGDASDARAQALLTAARRAFAASKLVRLDVDGRYPRRDVPAAYVCDRSACSPPVTDPAKLAAVVARAALPFACAAR